MTNDRIHRRRQYGRADGAQSAEGRAQACTAFDLSPAALKPVTDAGGKRRRPRSTRSQAADVVITMLPAGQHVRSVYLDERAC